MLEANGTIHPCPKLVTLAPDGDGGLRLYVHGHDGRVEVWPVTPHRAALMLAVLAGHLAERLKPKEAM